LAAEHAKHWELLQEHRRKFLGPGCRRRFESIEERLDIAKADAVFRKKQSRGHMPVFQELEFFFGKAEFLRRIFEDSFRSQSTVDDFRAFDVPQNLLIECCKKKGV
jgi:hypothetical protein